MCIVTKPNTIHLSKEGRETGKKFQGHHNIIVVQHNYHDYAHENLDKSPLYTPCRGGVLKPFPIKLHEMLNQVEADGNGDIVSWQPHGRCFVIRKPKEFQEQILLKYFKHSKTDSFKRQLNLYGFLRLTQGRDEGVYYHELFLRGKHFLANKIQRRKVKGTRVRARSNPNAEPDFWHMAWVGRSIASSSRSMIINSTSSTMMHGSGSWSHHSGVSNKSIFNASGHSEAPPASIHTELVPFIGREARGTTNDRARALSKNILSNSCLSTQFLGDNEMRESSCSFEGRRFHFVDELELLSLLPSDGLWEDICVPQQDISNV